MARDHIASLPAEQFPNMTELAAEFAFSDPDERFEMLIDIVLDGLAAAPRPSEQRRAAASSAAASSWAVPPVTMGG